jgi:hypothetical protein
MPKLSLNINDMQFSPIRVSNPYSTVGGGKEPIPRINKHSA